MCSKQAFSIQALCSDTFRSSNFPLAIRMKQALILSGVLVGVVCQNEEGNDSATKTGNWASNYTAGQLQSKFCRDGSAVSSLQWYGSRAWIGSGPGEGLVGLSFKCHGSYETNDLGVVFPFVKRIVTHGVTDCRGRKGITGLQFEDKSGSGFINARTGCGDGGIDTANGWEDDGEWLGGSECPSGTAIGGFSVWNQKGYGFVNIGYECRSLPEVPEALV